MDNNWKSVIITAIIFLLIGGAVYAYHEYNTKEEPKEKTKEEIEVDEDIIEVPEEEKEEETPKNEVTETFTNQQGKEVKITAEKIVGATGFAGSSSYKYYLIDGNLYYKNISSGVEDLIATGVKDLYLENYEVTAELTEEGKIVKENNYVTYK